MKYPEDRYHIRCTLEEISENDEAMELVTKAMKLITGMTLAKEEGMWDMMKKMKLESEGNAWGDGTGWLFRKSEYEIKRN